MLRNVLNLNDRDARGLHLIGRRIQRRKAEAAEVAEIDQWLAQMRNGPELVLYPIHPQSATPVRPASSRPKRRSKKRRR